MTKDLLGPRIREVEAQILDKHHEKQPLLQKSHIEAVSHLLKTYGNLLREFHSPEFSHMPDNTWLTEAHLFTLALEQSLRWAHQHCQPHTERSGAPWAQIDDEALTLLLWARSYVKLCTDHTAASRGHSVALCNDTKREITFKLKNTNDFTMLTGQFASWPIHTIALHQNMPEHELRRFFERWVAKVDLNRLKFHEGIPPFEHDSTDADFISVKGWARRAILPELQDCEDLEGFSLGELRDFWAYLFIECQLITRLELYVDHEIGPENDLGSILYQSSEKELADYFAKGYGMDNHTAASIIDCLCFDPKSTKSSLTNSPFIRTQCGTTSLLCRRVVTIDPDIMLSSALAKRSRKHIYANLINTIEQANVERIASEFRRSGFVTMAQAQLKGRNGDTVCPDLVVYEPATHQVLILDYKHALPPLGAGEVDNRLQDLDVWTEQIRKYLNFAAVNQDTVTGKLNQSLIAQIDGMLLFRWPIAIPGTLKSDVTFGDWPSLETGLRIAGGISINTILRYYRLPRDAKQTLAQWEIGEESIVVGDWTYKRPIVVSTPNKSEYIDHS
jgi:hypothetical protein